MSKNTPRFLLANNLLVCPNNFIVHTRKPFMVVEVIRNENVIDIKLNDSLIYSDESFSFILHQIDIIEFIEKDIEKILKRMAGWHAHLPMNKVSASDNPINPDA